MSSLEADLVNAIQQVADDHDVSERKLGRLLRHEALLYEKYPSLARELNRESTNECNDIRAHEVTDPSAHTTLDTFEQTN